MFQSSCIGHSNSLLCWNLRMVFLNCVDNFTACLSALSFCASRRIRSSSSPAKRSLIRWRRRRYSRLTVFSFFFCARSFCWERSKRSLSSETGEDPSLRVVERDWKWKFPWERVVGATVNQRSIEKWEVGAMLHDICSLGSRRKKIRWGLGPKGLGSDS